MVARICFFGHRSGGKRGQICQKSQRIGCMILCCKLQRGITQPILRLFWHICNKRRHAFHKKLVNVEGSRHRKSITLIKSEITILFGEKASSNRSSRRPQMHSSHNAIWFRSTESITFESKDCTYRYVKKSWRIGCVIPRCNLQCGITQPILQIFWLFCIWH